MEATKTKLIIDCQRSCPNEIASLAEILIEVSRQLAAEKVTMILTNSAQTQDYALTPER